MCGLKWDLFFMFKHMSLHSYLGQISFKYSCKTQSLNADDRNESQINAMQTTFSFSPGDWRASAPPLCRTSICLNYSDILWICVDNVRHSEHNMCQSLLRVKMERNHPDTPAAQRRLNTVKTAEYSVGSFVFHSTYQIVNVILNLGNQSEIA